MLRIVCALVACLLLPLTAMGQQLVDFKNKPEVLVFQPDKTKASISYEKPAGEENVCGLIQWEAANDPLITLYFRGALPIPGNKTSGNMVVNVMFADPVTRVAVRLMDHSGEMFHWDVQVTPQAGKWQKIVIPIKQGAEKAHWGGDKNGTIDLPLYLQGVCLYVHRKDAGGSLYIKDITFEPAADQAGQTSAPPVKQTVMPQNITQFYLTPGAASQLAFTTTGVADGGEVAYRITDGDGASVLSGRTPASPSGQLDIPVTLPQGYYEINFPSADCRYGICVTPSHEVNRDSFFCMDAAMSWLVRDLGVRKQLVRVMDRAGISIARERLYWSHIQPRPDVWNDDGGEQNSATRAAYQASGVKVMELIYASIPSWLRDERRPTVPTDLVAATQSVMAIVHHWPGAIGALEIWNEPEGFALSAPCYYMPLLKSIAYAAEADGAKVSVGGPAFAYNRRTYVQGCVDNGLTNAASFISFHYYGNPLGLQDVVKQYRQQVGGMPLWLTEFGKAWRLGPARPTAEQDLACARDIAMLAVEARACGVGRAFAFVLPYIEAGSENFGMTGKHHTPLRSLASYLQVINALSHRTYVGDLNLSLDKAIECTRVFGDDTNAVAVLYGSPAATIHLPTELAGLTYAGIDGRALMPDAQRNLSFKDGLVYVTGPRSRIDGLLHTDTLAMSLLKQAGPARDRAAMSPIVLQPGEADSAVTVQKMDYAITRDTADGFSIQLLVNNLSDAEGTATLDMQPSAGRLVADSARQIIRVSARSHATATWRVSLDKNASLLGQYLFRIQGEDDQHHAISPIAFNYVLSADLPEYLKAGDENYRLDIFNASRWKPNHGNGGTVDVSITPDGYWQMKTDFGKNADRWCFPQFTMDKPIVQWTPESLLVIRGRCEGPAASVKVVVWENNGVFYLTNMDIFPADGKWHTARIAYSDFSMFPLTPDPNQRLDLDQVKTISIGSRPGVGQNLLQISDVYIINTHNP